MALSIPIKLQRILFWATFWGIVAAILYIISIVLVLTLGLTFGTVDITVTTIGGVILEGLSQILTNATMGALGGLIWIGMKGERFGNWRSFFFWGVYWTLFDVIATTIMLLIYGFFSFNISFAILPGIIGIFGLSREKQFFRQHLFATEIKGSLLLVENESLPVEEQQRCPKCEAVISRNAKKCSWCGTRL